MRRLLATVFVTLAFLAAPAVGQALPPPPSQCSGSLIVC